MADRSPDKFVDDERATLTRLLQFQRESFVRKVVGVTDADASASPVTSGTTLLWLANHVADAETIWVLDRFAGRDTAPFGSHHAATLHWLVQRRPSRISCGGGPRQTQRGWPSGRSGRLAGRCRGGRCRGVPGGIGCQHPRRQPAVAP